MSELPPESPADPHSSQAPADPRGDFAPEGPRPHSAKPRSISYLPLLRGNRDFRILWAGQIVSLFGDWFNLIASASLIALLTESGLAVGGLFVIRMLAQFVGTQAGGVAADRYNRKRLLIATDLCRALVVLGFLVVRGPSQVWLLYALTALLMAISGVFFPTRTAILSDITSKREIGSANALTSITWSVMLAVGSALGGIAAGAWGIYQAFAVDAVSFLASAVLISRIRYQHARPETAAGLRQVIDDYMDGFRYLRRELDVLFITLHKAALGLLISGAAINVVMVQISESVFVIGEGGATGLGVIFTAVGAGTGLGPVVVRRLTGDQPEQLRWSLVALYLLAAVGLLVAAPLSSFAGVLLGMFLRTFAVGAIWVFGTQLLYQQVPDRYQGRVFSVEIALFTLCSAASGAVGGWVLDSTPLDLGAMMRLMGASALIPMLLWGLWMRRRRSALAPAPGD